MALLAAGAALLGGLTFLSGAKAKDGAASKPSRARPGTARTGVRASPCDLLRPDWCGVIARSPWVAAPPRVVNIIWRRPSLAYLDTHTRQPSEIIYNWATKHPVVDRLSNRFCIALIHPLLSPALRFLSVKGYLSLLPLLRLGGRCSWQRHR